MRLSLMDSQLVFDRKSPYSYKNVIIQRRRLLEWMENSVRLEGLFRPLSAETDSEWMTRDCWLSFYKRELTVAREYFAREL